VFVKPQSNQPSPHFTDITRTIQTVEAGEPMVFGFKGDTTNLHVGPNDPSCAEKKSLGAQFGVHWFSLTGLRACNVMIEAKAYGQATTPNNFQLAVTPAGERKDFVIPIVFPNYQVLIDTVEGVAINERLPLGHAGVLFIDGKRGVTKYYEYGRYPPGVLGRVHKLTIPDVKMSEGLPTKATLMAVLRKISRVAGHGDAIMAAFIALDSGAFKKMLSFCQRRFALNGDPSRRPYDIISFSCNTFAHDVAVEGGATMPPAGSNVFMPMAVPRVFMIAVQLVQPALHYQPSPEELTGAGF
jgi:hypothetical protein